MTKTPKALKAAPREPCRHDAAYVAHMLCYSPFDVFPYGPETTPEGNDHLVFDVTSKVDALAARLNDEDDGSEESEEFSVAISSPTPPPSIMFSMPCAPSRIARGTRSIRRAGWMARDRPLMSWSPAATACCTCRVESYWSTHRGSSPGTRWPSTMTPPPRLRPAGWRFSIPCGRRSRKPSCSCKRSLATS